MKREVVVRFNQGFGFNGGGGGGGKDDGATARGSLVGFWMQLFPFGYSLSFSN